MYSVISLVGLLPKENCENSVPK